jgi:hypothetical protein
MASGLGLAIASLGSRAGSSSSSSPTTVFESLAVGFLDLFAAGFVSVGARDSGLGGPSSKLMGWRPVLLEDWMAVKRDSRSRRSRVSVAAPWRGEELLVRCVGTADLGLNGGEPIAEAGSRRFPAVEG